MHRELDTRLLDGARRTVERHGWSGLTLQRRGVSRDVLLAALGEQLEREYREALWPALTAPGTPLERLELALAALCDVVDRNLELLDALGHHERDVVFHEDPKPALTKAVFTEPV